MPANRGHQASFGCGPLGGGPAKASFGWVTPVGPIITASGVDHLRNEGPTPNAAPSLAKARSAATTGAGVTGAAAAVSIRAAMARTIFLMLRSIGGLTVEPEAGFSRGKAMRRKTPWPTSRST